MKHWIISLRLHGKAKMYILTTPVEHTILGPSQCNKAVHIDIYIHMCMHAYIHVYINDIQVGYEK